MYTELLLTGNAFVEAVRLPGERALAALLPIRTGRVRPVKDAAGWVEAWAVKGRCREQRTTRSAGGKGGPKVNAYGYSVSFAVAIGEGPGVRVVRAWANGESFDLSGTVHRLYDGGEARCLIC